MRAYNTVEEIEALMKATKSTLILPKTEDSAWKKEYMGTFTPTKHQATFREPQDDDTRKVDPSHFEFIERVKSLPPMDLQPGEKNWIEKAKEKMAQSEGEKARQMAREREALEKAVAFQQALANKQREDEEKAAAEERHRRQIEEAQRTDWDIL